MHDDGLALALFTFSSVMIGPGHEMNINVSLGEIRPDAHDKRGMVWRALEHLLAVDP